MAPIIPAGGKKMDWVKDPEQPVAKTAQGMFDDDPQLSAIKDLPGMADGISELQDMTSDVSINDAPPVDVVPTDVAPATPVAGGAVEQAVEKVKDAAQAVADAALKDAEKAVTDAVKNVGKTTAEPVSEKVEEIKPDEAHEKSETPAEEAKEEHEKSETSEKEEKEEKCDKIPGVEGEKDGKVEKEGDKEDKDEKPLAFASSKGMRRLAELSASEAGDLRHYWLDLLGFPKEYVDAMLKKYRA